MRNRVPTQRRSEEKSYTVHILHFAVMVAFIMTLATSVGGILAFTLSFIFTEGHPVWDWTYFVFPIITILLYWYKRHIEEKYCI